MIFVSGANGQFAHAVISNLVSAGAAGSLAVGTRNVNSDFARGLAAQGVSVREADFRRPESIRSALAGVSKARSSRLTMPIPSGCSRTSMPSCGTAAGVKQVVYASFIRRSRPSWSTAAWCTFPEQAIRASGLDFTLLRHALYADILVGDLQATLASGLLHRPGGTTRCAYIAREDLGISAAQVLLRDEPSGRVYNETMEQTFSGGEVAELMSEVFGKPVRFHGAAEDWPRHDGQLGSAIGNWLEHGRYDAGCGRWRVRHGELHYRESRPTCAYPRQFLGAYATRKWP